MIRRNFLLEERISLHAHEVLNIAECGLYNAVVICCAVELRADDLVHQETGFGCVVCLSLWSVSIYVEFCVLDWRFGRCVSGVLPFPS
jgi:hypothetical protein